MTPFEQFIAPANRMTGIWRPVLGLVMIIVFWLLAMILVLLIWAVATAVAEGNVNAVLEGLEGFSAGQGGNPLLIIIMLASFGGVWVGLWLAGSELHAQRFRSYFAPSGFLRLGALVRGLVIGAAFAAASTAIGVAIVGEVSPGLSLDQWVIFVLPVILLVGVQATAEELVFRGYLLQQLAVRNRHWLVWAVLPSALFGVLHIDNLSGEAGYYYVAITFLMGCAMAVTVWRTGNLWTAIGIHVAVNIGGLTGITIEGPLAGTQLYLFDAEATIPLIQLDLAVIVLLLLFVLSPLAPLRADPASQAQAG